MHQSFDKDEGSKETDRRKGEILRDVFGKSSPFIKGKTHSPSESRGTHKKECPEDVTGAYMPGEDGKTEVTLF